MSVVKDFGILAFWLCECWFLAVAISLRILSSVECGCLGLHEAQRCH